MTASQSSTPACRSKPYRDQAGRRYTAAQAAGVFKRRGLPIRQTCEGRTL